MTWHINDNRREENLSPEFTTRLYMIIHTCTEASWSTSVVASKWDIVNDAILHF